MKHIISVEDISKPSIDEVWASSSNANGESKQLICHVEFSPLAVSYDVYHNTQPVFITHSLELAVTQYNQY